MLKKLILALAVALSTAPAWATQKTPTAIKSEINAQITSNGVGSITGPILNSILQDIADSYGDISCTQFPTLSGAVTTTGGGCVTTLAFTGVASGQLLFNNSGVIAGMTIGAGLRGSGTNLLLGDNVGFSYDSINQVVTVAGATLTGASSVPVLSLTQTWNNGSTVFTGVQLNVTNTASATSSLLFNLLVNSVSQFSVSRLGTVVTTGSVTGSYFVASSFGFYARSANPVFAMGSVDDIKLTRKAAANLQIGDVDAAAPVAQTISAQSVSTGTSNTAGQNWVFTGSVGTGTGIGGSIIFEVAKPGTSSSTPNALSIGFTIDGTTGLPILPVPLTVATLPTCNAGAKGALAVVSDATAPTYNAALTGGGAVIVPVFCNGTAWSSH